MLSRAFKSALLSAPLILGACLDDSGNDPAFVPQGEVLSRLNYSVSGDTLIFHDTTTIFPYCIRDSLAFDTSLEHGDTVRFSILGDTLILTPEPDSLDSGLVIQKYYLLIRQGKGQGIEDIWKTGPMRYSYISGPLTAARKAELDSNQVWDTEDVQYFYSYTEFRGGNITQYGDYDFGEKFIRDWNRGRMVFSGGDSSHHAIDPKRVDKHVVELKGRTTGETVRITFMNNFDRRYESDVPEHQASWYRFKPTTCPNDFQASWYTDFLQANRKAEAAAKGIAARINGAAPTPRVSPPSVFRALKSPFRPK